MKLKVYHVCKNEKKFEFLFVVFFFLFSLCVFYARTCRLNTLINVVAYIGFLSLNVFVNQFLFFNIANVFAYICIVFLKYFALKKKTTKSDC